MWGACLGQQLPLAEDCQTASDEDCDGATPACGAGFAKTFGTFSSAYSVAFDQDGNHYVFGVFDDTIDFGGGNTLTDVGPVDTFIAKLDPNGEHLWSHAIGDPIGTATPSSLGGLAVDSTGAVYAGLGFVGDVSAFGQQYESEGEFDGLLVKIAADGTPLRVTQYGSASSEFVESVVVDSEDNVVFTMSHFAPIYFGGPDVLPSGRALVKLDEDGNHVFSRTTTTSIWGAATRLALDPATDDILLYCQYDGTEDLGLGPIDASADGRSFFGLFDPVDGSVISYGTTGGQASLGTNALLFAPNGDIVLAGDISGGVLDFGQPDPGSDQAFIARLTSDLQPVFVETFSSFGDPTFGSSMKLAALALDSVGNATVFGRVGGASPVTAQIGPTRVVDASFLFEVDGQGAISNVLPYGPPVSLHAHALARAPDGVLVMAGLTYGGTFELGGQTLSTPVGNGEACIVRMSPN